MSIDIEVFVVNLLADCHFVMYGFVNRFVTTASARFAFIVLPSSFRLSQLSESRATSLAQRAFPLKYRVIAPSATAFCRDAAEYGLDGCNPSVLVAHKALNESPEEPMVDVQMVAPQGIVLGKE